MTVPFHNPAEFVHLVAPRSPVADGLLFVFRGDQLLVESGPVSSEPPEDLRVRTRMSWARVPVGHAAAGATLAVLADAAPLRALYLGTLAGTHCYAAEVSLEQPAPAGMAWQGLRALFSVMDDAHLALAGRALQLVDWDRNHQFCGRCAAPTTVKPDERARFCAACKLTVYPRISPAVMALVRRGSEILLARGPHFPPGMFSALAGFAEPGETLEECLLREVREEAGVDVTNIRYFASQPWPFPNSLMIAFVCDWHSGELRPQEGEIEEVAFFPVSALPKLPSKISIARRLIDGVIAEIRGS